MKHTRVHKNDSLVRQRSSRLRRNETEVIVPELETSSRGQKPEEEDMSSPPPPQMKSSTKSKDGTRTKVPEFSVGENG